MLPVPAATFTWAVSTALTPPWLSTTFRDTIHTAPAANPAAENVGCATFSSPRSAAEPVSPNTPSPSRSHQYSAIVSPVSGS